MSTDAGVALDGAAGDGGAADGGACRVSCGAGLSCCQGSCVDLRDDIHNCGACGVACGGAHPYCTAVRCTQAPCANPQLACLVGFCCGSSCCGRGQLCCDVGGPTCVDPSDGGTCPTGVD
jgi:hypothetical protein